MNKQQIFDKVARHLLAQNQVSMKHSRCLYKHPDGLMCAVGCLIPDDLYKVSIERHRVSSLTNTGMMQLLGYTPAEITRLAETGINRNNLMLLERLQTLHDSATPELWRAELLNIAQLFMLNTEALTCLN